MSSQPEALKAIEEAPEDIRKAIQQLSFVYKRSAETLYEAEDTQLAEAVRRAEAILFAAGEPLSAAQIAEALPAGVDVPSVLMTLKADYSNRGVRLVQVAEKWRFQTAEDLGFLFVEERHVQKKLTQAALETLAIIAYGQPVTRAEIEAVRGVAVSKGTIDQLMEAGWVKIKGRRKTPGRPVTLGTTDAFLEHFGLETLDLLPGRAELESEGLLSDVIPEGFEMEESEDDAGELNLNAPEAGTDDQEGFVTDFIGEEAED